MDILPKKKKESATDPYTTANTMAALEFDANDVCEELKAITVKDYAETMFDDRNAAAPPFFVFYRNIQTKDVYIKVKISSFQPISKIATSISYFWPIATYPSLYSCTQ